MSKMSISVISGELFIWSTGIKLCIIADWLRASLPSPSSLTLFKNCLSDQIRLLVMMKLAKFSSS